MISKIAAVAKTDADQTVLFVAEKRAAIDAVIKRLNHVGLSDTIMDLHGGITSRKELAQALSTSLHAVKTTSEPDPHCDGGANPFLTAVV